MNDSRGSLRMGLLLGALGMLVVLALGGLAVAYTGAYNVAATEQHMSVTRWAFDTTMRTSVQQRAGDAKRAEALTPDMVAAGAGEYKEMCQRCHGGPGVERDKWAGGMRPRPPHLAEAAATWQPHEVFWIAKHGVKMTGMPSFGESHDDTTIWNIVAFVKALPAMTPERYAALGGGSGQHAQGGGGHAR